MEARVAAYVNKSYQYGYTGMVYYKSINGTCNIYDFGARIYNSSLGIWLSVDPLQRKYPNTSPYVSVNDNPIINVDLDGRDWIYYDHQGNEIGRTVSTFWQMHWLWGDNEIHLTKTEVEKGGFFAYGAFSKGGQHSFIVDKATGDLYELRHPTNSDGQPIDGRENKEAEHSLGTSVPTKFEFDGNPTGIANEQWWTYSVKMNDGSNTDKSPGEVELSYIWIPNKQAMINFMNARLDTKQEWLPWDNCKHFCRDALLAGYEGSLMEWVSQGDNKNWYDLGRQKPTKHKDLYMITLSEGVVDRALPSTWVFEFETTISNPYSVDEESGIRTTVTETNE